MKNFIVFIIFCLTIFFSGCSKSGCDDCKIQKREFCLMLKEANCNGAMIQTNIDNLLQACGQEVANNYISAATDSCTRGILVCPEECQ